MNSVLILVFNILASSQAKPDPDTNMHIEHAQISMPAEKSGGGDYASQGNPDTNLHINKASIVMPESSGGLTFSTFSTFSTFYNILLQTRPLPAFGRQGLDADTRDDSPRACGARRVGGVEWGAPTDLLSN